MFRAATCRTRLAGAMTALAIISVAGVSLASRTRRWGASATEVARHLPGDQVVARPMVATTRAITIDAPASAVWPWLVQMGWHRAGWYSYDRIDNDHRPSAHHINPAWQSLQVGDLVPEGPAVGWTVTEIIPARMLLLESHGPMAGVDWVSSRESSWLFLLEPIDNTTTRLIERSRTAVIGNTTSVLGRHISSPLAGHVLALGDFVMAHKHMRGIKRRSERTGS